ncbi:hypothetical protein CQW23_19889 [Capsicum baccatum]|uniref:Uncharacterized protein n=1 Tax=Capsicum baccatum TaxID=33114 RepID=A0A2G2W727_CAPBA|nr:hypothetical protein CQW23_19889 [Capsicum baccatum]
MTSNLRASKRGEPEKSSKSKRSSTGAMTLKRPEEILYNNKCRKVRVRYFPRHTERKSRMTAFKRRVRDGERATEKEARPTGRGRLSKPNETRKNMGISTIHMSAFILSLRDNKTKGQPSLYLGLGLASYIALESIFFGCSADVGAAPLCCGYGGGAVAA